MTCNSNDKAPEGNPYPVWNTDYQHNDSDDYSTEELNTIQSDWVEPTDEAWLSMSESEKIYFRQHVFYANQPKSMTFSEMMAHRVDKQKDTDAINIETREVKEIAK